MPVKPQDRDEADHLATHLGDCVRELRLAQRLTQRELAERIGLTTQAFARLERGLSLPSFPTLVRLCRVLRTSADHLLGVGTDASEETSADADRAVSQSG